MKKNWRKKNKPTTKRNIKKNTQNPANNAKKRQATIEKTHNVGKQHEKQRSAQKRKPPSKTTGQSAETAAHNKRKAGDRQTTIK